MTPNDLICEVKSFGKYCIKHYIALVLRISGRKSVSSMIFITLFTPIFTFSNENPESASENNLNHFFVVKGTLLSGVNDSDIILIPSVKTENEITSKRTANNIDRPINCLKKIEALKSRENEKGQKKQLYFSSAPFQNPLSISKSDDKVMAVNISKYDFEKGFTFSKHYIFNIPTIIRNNSNNFFKKKFINSSILRNTDFARPPPLFSEKM